MRARPRVVGFRYPWIPVAVLLATAWLAVVWAQQIYSTLTRFPSRAPVVSGSEARPTAPLARQVVLVVVEGLPGDALRTWPGLTQLAQAGAAGSLTAVQPTYAAPNYAAMLSGAPPLFTGVLTDEHLTEAEVDTVVQRAGQARSGAAVVGTFAWDRLFPGHFSRAAAFGVEAVEPRTLTDRALAWLDQGFSLVVVEYARPAVVARAYGTGSEEYSGVCGQVDAEIGRLAAALDLSQDAMIVLSPHGILANGGYGGREVTEVPVVLLGSGIKPLAKVRGRMLDLAPTLSLLLGVAFPSNTLGKPLAALQLPPDQLKVIEKRLELLHRALADAYFAREGLRGHAGTAPLEDLLGTLDERQDRAQMLRFLLLLGLVAGCLAWAARLDRRGWRPLLRLLQWGAVVAMAWNLIYLLVVGPASPSRITAWSQLRLLGVFCALLGFALVTLASFLRGTLREPGRPATGGLEVVAGTAAVMAFEVLCYPALYGFPLPAVVPRADLTLAAASLLAGLVGVCLAAPLTPLWTRALSRWPIRTLSVKRSNMKEQGGAPPR